MSKEKGPEKNWSSIDRIIRGSGKGGGSTMENTEKIDKKISNAEKSIADERKQAEKEIAKHKESLEEELKRLKEILKTRPLTEEERKHFQDLVRKPTF